MTEWVEQQICIRFCIKFEHSSRETIQVIPKPQLRATGDWQLHHDNVPAHVSCPMQSFLVKHQITQVTQSPYSLDLVPCDFWLFPKLKSPFKGKRFQTVDEIQENTTGQLMVIGRTVWGTPQPQKCLLWRGLRHHYPMYSVSCVLYLLQWMSLFFILYGWIPSGQTSYYPKYVTVNCASSLLLWKRLTCNM